MRLDSVVALGADLPGNPAGPDSVRLMDLDSTIPVLGPGSMDTAAPSLNGSALAEKSALAPQLRVDNLPAAATSVLVSSVPRSNFLKEDTWLMLGAKPKCMSRGQCDGSFHF